MASHDPISIKVTYTNAQGELVETEFRSLYKASKILHISTPALKELSLGGTAKLKPEAPQDIKVSRIPTLPKPPKKPTDSNEIYHCDLCNKDMKLKSKYEHVSTMGHKKKLELLENTNKLVS
jgi:hypothetical protein